MNQKLELSENEVRRHVCIGQDKMDKQDKATEVYI